MKNFLLSAIILFSVFTAKAQITLDTTIMHPLEIGYGFKLVQISESETKWFFCDTLSNTFSLLNIDFSPFLLDVSVPEPFAPTSNSMQVLYVTRTLFDCDSSNIEYAYYTSKNIGKPFKILRTDGTLLFQKDSANGPYLYGGVLGGTDVVRPIVNTSSGAKLFLQPYPQQKPVYVYSLCGKLPLDVFDFKQVERMFVELYPNPVSQELKFHIHIPSNSNDNYELTLMDINGNIVKREAINYSTSNLSLNVDDLSSGSYIYSVAIHGNSLQSGKFVITK